MTVNTLAAFAAAALVTGNDIRITYNPCDCGAKAHSRTDHHPECTMLDIAGAVAEQPHACTLDYESGLVRARCVTCGWTRFGGWHSTRTAEGTRLAEQDGRTHLSAPDVPAFAPQGW